MVSGPVLWFGGKGHLASWIVEHLPDHEIYVEPYGGAAAVLFTKEPAPIEVYNDVHKDLTNLFTVLRDPESAGELHRRTSLILHSRVEYEQAVADLQTETDPVDRATAFFVAMNQGFGGTQPTPGRWASSRGQRLSGGMGNNTAQWWRKVAWIDWWHERLARVQIEGRDALDVIRAYDSERTTFYVDPPYLPDLRVDGGVAYLHDAGEEHHRQLVEMLSSIKGSAVLSGYDNELYGSLGWHSVERNVHARGAGNAGGKSRVEKLWIRA